jgi:hypothetical protein
VLIHVLYVGADTWAMESCSSSARAKTARMPLSKYASVLVLPPRARRYC